MILLFKNSNRFWQYSCIVILLLLIVCDIDCGLLVGCKGKPSQNLGRPSSIISWDQFFSSRKDDPFTFPIRELSMVDVDVVKTHINTSCHYRYIYTRIIY